MRNAALLFLFTLTLACCTRDEDKKPPFVEPNTVYIYNTNTGANGTAFIKNNSGADQDVTNWRMVYSGPYCTGCQFTIPSGTPMQNQETRQYQLGFMLPDTETYYLYLQDENGNTINTWEN